MKISKVFFLSCMCHFCTPGGMLFFKLFLANGAVSRAGRDNLFFCRAGHPSLVNNTAPVTLHAMMMVWPKAVKGKAKRA